MAENPWVVQSVVEAQLSERQFKAMVKAALSPSSGTAIFGLQHRQGNGDWRIGRVEVRAASVVKLDQRRELPRGAVDGYADTEWDPSAPAPSDFVGVRKASVEWAVEWIDFNGAADIERDAHGREKGELTLREGGGMDRLAASIEKMVAVASPSPSPSPGHSPAAPAVARKRDRSAESEREKARRREARVQKAGGGSDPVT
jgi:hypothetical protein